MRLERSTSLEERWLEVFRALGDAEAILACTFAFNADFFSNLLARFAEASLEGGKGEGQSFTRLPVDVVCDKTRYRGHRAGFNVSLWPNGARLFHPKVFIALFSDEVVWSDGSLNLTPAGWRRNREIAMVHRPGRRAIPRPLRELLEALPANAAAQRILERTVTHRAATSWGRFLTSLREPIGRRFLAGAPRDAEEVHLIAPFFEKEESSEAPLEERWLRELVTRYRTGRFHVYLPRLGEAEPLRVQGSRGVFEAAEHRLENRIVLHPVEPSPGPLHGKVACVVHRRGRTRRVLLLLGSPNMTHAALLASPARGGNVETAWILDERWEDVRRLLSALGSTGCSIDDAEFTAPSLPRASPWTPLRRATHDPLRRTLRVEWKNPGHARLTELRYDGRRVTPDGGGCLQPFDLVDGVAWLVTRKRGGGAADGRCPIDVPVELLAASEGIAIERTPEDWLRMLGASWGERGEGGHRSGARQHEPVHDARASFEWSERVRGVAAQMEYVRATFCEERESGSERRRIRALVRHIYEVYEPRTAAGTLERVWYAWVRLELWHVAWAIAAAAPSRRERADWRSEARRLRRRMGIASLPPEVQRQLRLVVRALRAAA